MLTLFLVPQIPINIGDVFILDGDEGHHAARALRITVREEVLVTDGQGSWVRAETLSVEKKSLTLRVLESGREDKPRISITLVQGLPKSDRAKEAIELCTGAGVDIFLPWQASRSISKGNESTVEKFQSTANEASKQSRRFWTPIIGKTTSTADVVALIAQADVALVFHESASMKLSDIPLPSSQISQVLLIVGPEGGLTDEEVQQFTQAGASLCLLGRPILRSAHAGIAAISAVSSLLKIW